MPEYRVLWQREGQVKKRRIYQTLNGAERCALVQESAAADMEWLKEPPSEIIWGPVIQSREVGEWDA